MLVVIVQAQSKELFDTVFRRLVSGVQQFQRQVVQVQKTSVTIKYLTSKKKYYVQVLIFQTGVARQCVFDIRREKIMGAECLQQHDLILRQKRRKELFQNPNLPRHQIVVRFHPKSPRFPVMTQTPTWY